MKNELLDEDTFSIPQKPIEDEFANRKDYSQLYERAYFEKQNLCRRLGKDEDSDIGILMGVVF